MRFGGCSSHRGPTAWLGGARAGAGGDRADVLGHERGRAERGHPGHPVLRRQRRHRGRRLPRHRSAPDDGPRQPPRPRPDRPVRPRAVMRCCHASHPPGPGSSTAEAGISGGCTRATPFTFLGDCWGPPWSPTRLRGSEHMAWRPGQRAGCHHFLARHAGMLKKGGPQATISGPCRWQPCA